MWLNKQKISYNAYCYCRFIKDVPEVRKFITESYYAYWYCRFIKNDPEVRKHITDEDYLEDLKKRRRNVDE